MNLFEAPPETLLRVISITDPAIASQLARTGLEPGSECHKHLHEAPPSLRIKSANATAVIGSGMSQKIFIRCNNITKRLSDILFEDEAVIHEIRGGRFLLSAMDTLGFPIGTACHLQRRLPPMEYVLRLNDNRHRIKISDAVAAKVLGTHTDDGPTIQFTSARIEYPFTIRSIIGGRKTVYFVKELGLKKGQIIHLEGVEHSKYVHSPFAMESDICIKMRRGGLRIYVTAVQATSVIVERV